MPSRGRNLLAGVFCLAFLLTARSEASVIFSFTNPQHTSSFSVAPGGTVTDFTLDIQATSTEQIDGLDYYLQASTSSIFTLASRNTTTDGTPFSTSNDPSGDSSVVSAGKLPGLNPVNGDNLGATTTNLTPVTSSNGLTVVADYTLSVSMTAPPGVYTISTANDDWVDPTLNPHALTTQGVYTVTVTPEPATAGLLAIGAMVGLTRRPRRRA